MEVIREGWGLWVAQGCSASGSSLGSCQRKPLWARRQSGTGPQLAPAPPRTLHPAPPPGSPLILHQPCLAAFRLPGRPLPGPLHLGCLSHLSPLTTSLAVSPQSWDPVNLLDTHWSPPRHILLLATNCQGTSQGLLPCGWRTAHTHFLVWLQPS